MVYDGAHIALRFVDPDGAGPQASSLANRYFHNPQLVDQILADEQVTSLTSPGNVIWPLPDNQGTVRDLADNNGDVVNHLVFDAFGNIVDETNAAVDHIFGYTGREKDEESDLQFYRNRYYDSINGRFITEDPKGFAAGDENLSRYVGNSPTNYTDPFGLDHTDNPADHSGGGDGSGDAEGGTIDDGDASPNLYFHYLTCDDSWLSGLGNGLKGLAEGLNPLTIPDEILALLDERTWATDVEAFHRLRTDSWGYTGERLQLVSDGISDQLSTPAGWGEAYVNVGSALIARKFAGAAKPSSVSAGMPMRFGKRIPGALYGEEKLQALVGYLQRRGVTVQQNAVVSKFVARSDGSMKLYLMRNPTRCEILHELSHYLDRRNMGFRKFGSWSEDQLEINAINRTRLNRSWESFADDEIEALKRAFEKDHKGNWRDTPRVNW